MPLEWCKNYLSGRQQCTLANGLISDKLDVSCGVPQGSVLGPLFFLIYVNDIQEALEDCGLKLYADDTVLYQSGVNADQAVAKLQGSMDTFARWCRMNALTINAKKTKVMFFGSRNKVKKGKNISVNLNGETLRPVPSFKYLGFTLDPTLSFSHHVSSVVRSVQHKISLLSKIKVYLNQDVAITIYKSMILPYFDYADVIFGNANAGELDKLQRLQNCCLKLCMGRNRRFGTEQVHAEAGVPLLKARRVAHIRNFMFQRKTARPALPNNRVIGTRAHDAPLFTVAIPRCEAFKRSVGYYGAKEWNGLSPDVRNIGTYPTFKNVQSKLMLTPG